jgi:hypothetical protein
MMISFEKMKLIDAKVKEFIADGMSYRLMLENGDVHLTLSRGLYSVKTVFSASIEECNFDLVKQIVLRMVKAIESREKNDSIQGDC